MRIKSIRAVYAVFVRYCSIISLLSLLAGCFGGGVGTGVRAVEQYQLQYASPHPVATAPMQETITIDRFISSPYFLRNSMIFQTDDYLMDAYQYHRWSLVPGDMATELLRRDLRASGLFQGVFSRQDLQPTRFRLTGRIEEFHEIEREGRQAALAILITLFEQNQQKPESRILFQKMYRQRSKLQNDSPAGLAQAMSQALEALSHTLVKDIASAVTARN